MKRNLLALSFAFASAITLWPDTAWAQYGYPRGYGGYGWGGWGGSTVQGSIARGMGMFNMGRGMYNVDTAQARSINVNTAMRWNQYVYESQQNANRLHHGKLALQRYNSINDIAKIEDRLRNHPEARDITDGDALNVLLDVLLSPASSSSSLQYIRTPLRHDIIPDIPFEVASEGMTVCLDSMTMDGQWPLALRVGAIRPEREALRQAIQKALKEDEQGDLEPETVEAVQKAIDNLRLKFEKLVPQDNPDYLPARNAIKAMAGITKMLYSPKLEKVLAELEDYQGTTLGDLLGFMQAFNLRFAPANSFRQRQIYNKLSPMLVEQANALQASLSNTAGGVEGAAAQAVGAAENVGSKAVEGLKAAATDFFKDMGWEHLKGSSGSAPAQP
jgi:hypothetical protein